MLNIIIIFFSGFLLVLAAHWLLNLFSKVNVKYDSFLSRKVVFRVVHDDISAVNKEQSIYTKRVRSLWGKVMCGWSTFRITFPHKNNFFIFGLVVPDTFHIDKECLDELGFDMGEVDFLQEAAIIEMPMRTKIAMKLNKMRCVSAISSISKEAPYAEFRDWKTKKHTFVITKGSPTGIWQQ